MTSTLDEFIQLDRTFHELALENGAGGDVDLTRHLGERDALRWPNLLSEFRVILLSEAGSGKTAEIRNIARALRQEGKPAFFVRIEHVCYDFEDAFEEGSFDEFETWKASGEEGWLLLDSVDEARLRDPGDFERAIKKIGRLLKSVLQQAHIVITGRSAAWRPQTDLMLCQAQLPYSSPRISNHEASNAEETQETITDKTHLKPSQSDIFRIVALENLHGVQIDAFLRGKKVADLQAFRDGVERKDAWSLTTRPQDLAELIEFWKENHRIGSRLELMRSSIGRRLEERDQNRSEFRPISVEKLRLGARLVAAATTLAQESAIRVPDGADNTKGISIREVLPDWDDIDCAKLLSRPIFDEGIYGTVRFHHRSVREYLTAEWLHTLMVDDGSRSRVENLFFRTQYGIEVIVPTMRPVLPWLSVLDERILARVCRLTPEIVFEGGDPSPLRLATRRKILRQVCEQLSQPAHGRSITDYGAVQRFANIDLTDEIKALLAQYEDDDDITWFLLRMVWQGEIVGAATEAKKFALNSREEYTRIAAFRALGAIGSDADRAEVRHAFLNEDGELNRHWLAELIPGLPKDCEGVTWLLDALSRTPTKEQYRVDDLLDTVSQLIHDLPLQLVPTLITGLNTLLETPPVVDRHNCGISTRHGWLLKSAADAVVRLVEERHPAALDSASLSILRKLPLAEAYGEYELRDSKGKLSVQITQWHELNYALFWQDVAETRAGMDARKGECLTQFFQVGPFSHFWKFGADSFVTICRDIATRILLDDRHVALTLAFAIYRENGRPATWRKRLRRLASSHSSLKSTLDGLLHPQTTELRKWRQEEARWKKRAERRTARLEENRRKWKTYLNSNLEALRDPGKRGVVTNPQLYLYERMRDAVERSDKWSEGRWQSLIPEFSEPIALGFRDGAVRFWRDYRPQLLSEGAVANSTPFSVIFGLTGLSIESRETDGWPTELSESEADIAMRYALHELNGFPNWLPRLYATHPKVVVDRVITEIDHELKEEDPVRESYYVLYDVSWSGDWMWDRLAPLILERLRRPPKNTRNLRYMLNVIQGSILSDSTIAKLAAKKAKATKNVTTAPMWFAVWVGVDPAIAIPALTARLAEMEEYENKTLFAMRFITALIGGRHERGSSRQSFRAVTHMKELYLLMHEYVSKKDDINRVGQGVYSPGLRDEAQDARDALFSFIREAPGKEAFLALTELSRALPTDSDRSWLASHAKEKATLDSNFSAWSPQQVREFHDRLERTPANHRDLWYLAVDRLLDLKYDLEEGDASVASILQPVQRETEIRKYIGNWCRERSGGRYVIPQEEELADAKRPDLRFHGVGFDSPVPAELKLADKWTGPHLFERLETQLCGNYLRDKRSSRGIFLLVYHGTKSSWDLPNGKRAESFGALIEALRDQWTILAPQFPAVEDINVIGIDLTKRGADMIEASNRKIAQK